MRDFSSISPSARSIILMKGHTDIPYAQEAAELVSLPQVFAPDYSNKDLLFWSKVLHFETRYRGINQLLEGINVNSFVELSSGFNLRCIEISGRTGKPYFDTDLPNLLDEKRHLVEQLRAHTDLSNVHFRPLNVLDDEQFQGVVDELPPGKVAIVTEGLLMYFSLEEKQRLCAIVGKTLRARGGYWVTSDIYIRARAQQTAIRQDSEVKAFTDRHNVEDNKFSSFDEARNFFSENGFVVEKEESLDVTQFSSFKHLLGILPEQMRSKGTPTDKMQTSWRLTVKT